MDLTLTVVAAATGATADVRVRSADTGPPGGLLAALRTSVGASVQECLSIDGRPLAADGTTADCGLHEGVVLDVGASVPATTTSLVELAIASGPGAGQRHFLEAGEHVIGRDSRCQVAIEDPSISRRHLLLHIDGELITVEDLGSANGTTLDGTALSEGPGVALTPGGSLRLGDSELRISTVSHVDQSCGGAAIHHRAPRLQLAAVPEQVVFPSIPIPAAPTRIPILAALAPLVAGVVLAVVLHQWQFLAFTALSPIMILGQAAGDRLSSRRSDRRARRDHATATATAELELGEAMSRERTRRRAEVPDLAELTRTAAERTALLWHRGPNDPAAMMLRLGLGESAAELHVVGGPGAVTVNDVPICAAMPDLAVLGICGPRALTAGLARSLLVQAAVLHGPAQLRIVVLAPGLESDWSWVRWLPHLRARSGEPCRALVGFDDEQVSARIDELTAPPPKQRAAPIPTLVLVDGADMARSTALTALSERANGNLTIIWCAPRERELPGMCGAVAELTGTPRVTARLTRRGESARDHLVPDLLCQAAALAAARTLAPLSDGSTTSGALPAALRWDHVAGIDLSDHASAVHALTRQWSRGPSTTVTLGRTTDGVLAVDLVRDGPHALVAGTTGSGKSELLLSLVAGLAARNRPDQLSLLLIDHKGGAAFGRCADLPHTVGVVTDLDGASTRRALLSLTAELRRREALFGAVAVADLESYDAARLTTPDLTPLARLIIIVDEFATLAEEQPEFVGGLVGIAQRGRSLGVHLILATQRPEGVVSADIRANTRLRICLGVARENESHDVIDCPDAAAISRTTPGRGYLRIGPGELREFQTARIGGRRNELQETSVTLSPAATLGSPPSALIDEVGSAGSTDLVTLIGAAREVSASLECRPPPPPWLPPLPECLELSSLPADPDPRLAAWGLLDLPAAGQQRPLTADLRAGSAMVIAGASRSGRTTAAQSIAMSAAARRGPDDLAIWAIDAGSGLRALAEIPHCGGVVPAHDADRVERLLRHLTAEVARRRQVPASPRPALMLLVDSWEGLTSAADPRDGTQLVDTVLRLAADGPAADLHLVVTCDRAGLVGRLGGSVTEKIVLRLADPADYAFIGMGSRDLPRQLPAGRGVRAGDLALVQIAQVDDAVRTAARDWPPPRRATPRFEPLPRRVALPDLATDVAQPAQVTLGVCAEDLSTLTVTRRQIGPSFTILGSSGSGRSTALRLLACQLRDRRIAISCASGSPLADHPDAIVLPRDDQDHAVALLDSLCAGTGVPDVLIDDVDHLIEGPLWSRLEELIRHPSGDGQVIALAGSIDTMSAAFRGPIAQARRAKTGILLCPTGLHDGEGLGIRLPRRPHPDDPPGRGWFAARGVATRIQLADPAGSAPRLGGSSDQPSTELELSRLGGRSRE